MSNLDLNAVHLKPNDFESAMFALEAQLKSEAEWTDSTLQAIEETKKRWLRQVSQFEILTILSKPNLPKYVRDVLGKRHGRELACDRNNCINAALNFHNLESEALQPVSPLDFLRFLLSRTDQLSCSNDFQFGDLIVWWNRSGGAWDNRKILIKDIDFLDPDFPYGLIFDHVAVRITPEIVFNKPNPSPLSEYRFDYLETASYPSRLIKGHEITLHRVRLKLI